MKEKSFKGKYAWTVKIGEKGQFVIPKKVRDLFDLQPGDSIILLGDIKKGLAIPHKSMLTKLASQIFDGKFSEDEEQIV